MKRTKNIRHDRFRKNHQFWRYTAIAVVVAGSFALGGCDSYTDESVSVYKNVQECLQNNPNDKGQCNSDYLLAQKKSADTAPKYSSRNDCNEEFGDDRCQVQHTSSGGMMWYPIMSGFTNSSSSYASQPMYSSMKPTSPMYNKFVDAKGNSFGHFYDAPKRMIPSNYMGSKPSSTTTTTRGGFGGTVRTQAEAAHMASMKSSSSSSSFRSSSSSSGGRSFGG